MNAVIKAQVDQFKLKNPITGFNDADYFEVYSIFSIINGYRNENVDPFEVHLKGKEFGIDGCGIILQGNVLVNIDDVAAYASQIKDGVVEFVFVQSKSSTAFEYGEISKFLHAVVDFFSDGMNGESGQLDDLIETKDRIYEQPLRKNPKISCFFVSTGNYNGIDRTERLIGDTKSRLEDLNLFESIEI